MNPRLLLLAVGKVVGFPSRLRLWQFYRACRDPRRHQDRLLGDILSRHADTAFGLDHRFAMVTSAAEYRRAVPLADYDYHEPYLARVRRGETDALLTEPPLMFALTSGTTAARKTIPVTRRYLKDYQRGWNRWGLRALLDHQVISCAPILQLAGDMDEFVTEAGTPCGSLSGLTVKAQLRYVRFLYCFPEAACAIRDPEAKLYAALRFSIGRPVGLITAANPSTLVQLGRALERHADELLRDLHDGTLGERAAMPKFARAQLARRLRADPRRSRQLSAILHREGRLWPRDVWPPERMLLGTWTGGSVGLYLPRVREMYGPTFVRDLGLLASEGRFTIPLDDGTPSGVLDVTTHYFEFIPEGEIESANPATLSADELDVGRNYFLVPTTAAGLYRYDIRDLVRVTGHFHRTPLVEFLSKGRHFSNLTGEKLSEYQVTAAVAAAASPVGKVPTFALAPCWDDRQPYYGLFVDDCGEDELRALAAAVERQLTETNSEYAAKRATGRLGAVRGALLPAGTWAHWDAARQAERGGPAEQYKHPCLINDVNFRGAMTGVKWV